MSPVSTMLHRTELEAGRKNEIGSWLWMRSPFPKLTLLENTKSKS